MKTSTQTNSTARQSRLAKVVEEQELTGIDISDIGLDLPISAGNPDEDSQLAEAFWLNAGGR